MSEINVGSTELLAALESSLGRAADSIQEALPLISARVQRASSLLEERQLECRREISYWERLIDSADDEDDTSEYHERIADLHQRLAGLRGAQSQLQAAEDSFQKRARRLEQLSTEGVDKARSFLRRRIDEIEAYVGYRTEDGSSGAASISAGSASGSSVLPALGTGYRRRKKDPQDWLWRNLYGPVPEVLPHRITLESFQGPAYDQGSSPQCVCYSLATLKHHDECLGHGLWLHFDPSATYSACKARDGAPFEDGTTIKDAFKVACNVGLVDQNGQRQFVRGYARTESVNEIKHALSLRKTVMLGAQINQQELSNLGADAIACTPDCSDGGHCMLAVGYDDSLQAFRVRNSWGRDWADNGHFWLPYDYISSDPDFEAWTSVCEKVNPPDGGSPDTRTELPNRELSDSNFAWFDPMDIDLSGDDGPQLEWNRLSRDDARAALERILKLRAHISLADLKSGTPMVRDSLQNLRDATGSPELTEADLAAFDLFFGSQAIRIDCDGQGGFMVINGRHRLYMAQQLGISSVPVSVSNAARRVLRQRIEGAQR